MAGYRQHVSLSGLLGIGYGAAGIWLCDFTPVQGALAGVLVWVSGMLPDLDSDSGRPVREVFSLLAAVVPMMLVRRLVGWGGNLEGTMFLAVLIYATIRYGGPAVLSRFTVHRGMFHSIPAAIIAAEVAFLAYASDSQAVRLLMACGVAAGFVSHLVLDEVYAVSWSGIRIRLNRMAGSAMKLFSRSSIANLATYSLLTVLTYCALRDAGLLEELPPPPSPDFLRQAAEDAPSWR